ncbi:type II toxin-antitoxin system RelE/ParE family toxin [Nannocystis punicea]|uniref:Type II toxin-antitoxin system RelE/ParE family toxin n=1 Tax=Nannocystis punicea TaxID=2995304 RepID=A0ABY7HD52_9BACT|nr:type II toxin-antitoxin system RelE/ParE family toxin [Nannocystis poenicansa]WAS97199.1 type II toxin-antitoxin system RelE/ParE family toxin [Nannocystis poenicansa]
MIQSFKNRGTRDLFDGKVTAKARGALPADLWERARDKLDVLNRAHALEDLQSPPGNQLELLKGDRAGQHSIRINKKYRVCFIWTPEGPTDVEIIDYH